MKNGKYMFKAIPLKPELDPEVYSVPLPELAGFIKGQLDVECPTIIDNGERYTDVNFEELRGQLIIAYAKQGERLKAVATLPA